MVSTGERIRIWWNERAGRGMSRSLADRTLGVARERGHDAALLPPDRAEATASLAGQIEAGALDRLIVVGGDGTAHQAIQAAAGTTVAVGIVPAGSGNDLGRALGLDPDPGVAIERALGPATAVDLLCIGDRYGLTVATLGFSVAVNRRAEAMRWPRGSAKYTVATVAELADLRRYPVTLRIDGKPTDTAPNLLALANTPIFGGGMAIAPEARPDDGELDLVVIGPASRASMLRLLPGVRKGRHIHHPRVEVHRAKRVTIEAHEAYQVWADGEFSGTTPVDIEIAPAALRLAGNPTIGIGIGT